MKKLFAFLLVALLAVALVACGDSADTTKNPGTSKAPVTSTDPTASTPTTTLPQVSDTQPSATTAPVATTVPVTTPGTPVTLSAPEQKIWDWDEAEEAKANVDDEYVVKYATYLGTHEAPSIQHNKTGKDGIEYKYMFHFTFQALDDFINDPDTAVPGVQFTTADSVYIGEMDEYGDVAEFTKYEIEYWAPDQWYILDFVATGFVPEDGKSYDIYLFFMSDETHCKNPNSLYYMWDMGNPFVYEAPAPIESQYAEITELVPDIARRTQLLYHDTFTIDAAGAVRYTFKSDNMPFNDGTAEDGETAIHGVSFTVFDSLFINGEEVNIVADSYLPELWYVINFTIDNYTFVPGETYEFIFTVNSTDDLGTYCNDPDGYFVLYNYVAPEPVA